MCVYVRGGRDWDASRRNILSCTSFQGLIICDREVNELNWNFGFKTVCFLLNFTTLVSVTKDLLGPLSEALENSG